MTQKATFDLLNQLTGGVSVQLNETMQSSVDETGSWVDASGIEGPVQALCAVGAATGSPTAQSINFVLDEADDSSGTNAQEVTTQTEVVLTADDTFGIITAKTTKPYVRVVCDQAGSSFTGGSSPGINIIGVVLGQKSRV